MMMRGLLNNSESSNQRKLSDNVVNIESSKPKGRTDKIDHFHSDKHHELERPLDTNIVSFFF